MPPKATASWSNIRKIIQEKVDFSREKRGVFLVTDFFSFRY
jgi:hypothetical protein